MKLLVDILVTLTTEVTHASVADEMIIQFWKAES
jgi:hypothetical protein